MCILMAGEKYATVGKIFQVISEFLTIILWIRKLGHLKKTLQKNLPPLKTFFYLFLRQSNLQKDWVVPKQNVKMLLCVNTISLFEPISSLRILRLFFAYAVKSSVRTELVMLRGVCAYLKGQ